MLTKFYHSFYDKCSNRFLEDMRQLLFKERIKLEDKLSECDGRITLIDKILKERDKPYPRLEEPRKIVITLGPMK